jgi:hypothetical protein
MEMEHEKWSISEFRLHYDFDNGNGARERRWLSPNRSQVLQVTGRPNFQCKIAVSLEISAVY